MTVLFLCTDSTSEIVAGSCPATYTAGDGQHPARTSTVANTAGKTTKVTVPALNVDTVDPTLAFTGNAGTYTIDQTVRIACTASDALSGIDPARTRCGTTTVAAWQAWGHDGDDGDEDDEDDGRRGSGGGTVSAVATDRAGDAMAGLTRYIVTVTCPSLRALTASFVTSASSAAAMDAALTTVCLPTATAREKRTAAAAYERLVRTERRSLGNERTNALLAFVEEL